MKSIESYVASPLDFIFAAAWILAEGVSPTIKNAGLTDAGGGVVLRRCALFDLFFIMTHVSATTMAARITPTPAPMYTDSADDNPPSSDSSQGEMVVGCVKVLVGGPVDGVRCVAMVGALDM